MVSQYVYKKYGGWAVNRQVTERIMKRLHGRNLFIQSEGRFSSVETSVISLILLDT